MMNKQGKQTMAQPAARKPSNYEQYWAAQFNQPTYYPVRQTLSPDHYQPIGEWMGRLILPAIDERDEVLGALMEVYHADAAHQDLVGQVVRLRWRDDAETNARFWGITQPVFFDDAARKTMAGGAVLPERLDQRPQVNPLESLAGARAHDDIVVRLHGPIEVNMGEGQERPILYTPRLPAQITGRSYALVRFLAPVTPDGDQYSVAHFNRQSGNFDGPEEVVRLPQVLPDINGIHPSVNRDIEKSPANALGWYIFGAQDPGGVFTVLSIAPRGLLRCQPEETIIGQDVGKKFLAPNAWRDAAKKGTFQTTLLCPDRANPAQCLAQWEEGDRLLLVHLYGGIGGPKGEREARSPLYWGHFAFGVATIVREPLANELSFDIEYHQVYAHNSDGLIAGTLHWSRYSGDRQMGWMGVRPIQDMIIKLDCFTDEYDFGWLRRSATDQMSLALEVMTSRYRIADGRGGTRVSAANNCAQDSNQALYAAVRNIHRFMSQRDDFQDWRAKNPVEAQRADRLIEMGEDLRKLLLPFGSARADWQWGMATIGSSLADNPIDSLGMALRSWRTMIPPIAARGVAEIFAKHGASIWVLRTFQVGGHDPGIEPRIPNV
jgi:predicted Abi (CAAX) family protease